MTLLARAMGHLQARPPVFQYVMDEFCAARRAALARAFIDALTIGGPGGYMRHQLFFIGLKDLYHHFSI